MKLSADLARRFQLGASICCYRKIWWWNPQTQHLFVFAIQKGKRRGIGREQHSKVTDLASTRFLSAVFGSLPPGAMLYPGGPAAFRLTSTSSAFFFWVDTSLNESRRRCPSVQSKRRHHFTALADEIEKPGDIATLSSRSRSS